MGNCVFKGNGADADPRLMIKVVTWNGGVMELYPPITAESITNGFPGHGIYSSSQLFSRPLIHNEELVSGQLYHLRPLNNSQLTVSVPPVVAPYRVSFDHTGFWRRQEYMQEMLPSTNWNRNSYVSSGMWKVKLVISPKQLNEILSQESRTEALIESVRTVAKCGINGSASGSTMSGSDQWSLASSRKAGPQNLGCSDAV